jgi:YidC/Oxa1 family membrane protein insertase
MNQTRTFLMFAWLAVATLLWMAWDKDHQLPTTPVTETAATAAPAAMADAGVPAIPAAPLTGNASGTAPAPSLVGPATSNPAPVVSVSTDVLQVSLDGGAIHRADILRYPVATEPGSPSTRLFDDTPEHFFEAQSGWISSNGAPSHVAGFEPATPARSLVLAPGQKTLQVPFVWHGANGVTIQRTYTFTRGDYVVAVRDVVSNAGATPWQGFVYRQLVRVPPQIETGMMHPESYSFRGAAWFSAKDKLEKRKFDKYGDDPPLTKPVTGGWISMLQHHFFTAWIPGANDASTFSTAVLPPGQDLIREVGPGVTVAPGASASTQARLWVGPKLVAQIQAQQVPGLERAVDFSSFSMMAVLAGWLFWVLQRLHDLLANWGWSIVGLVVLIKLAMYPLSAAQYKSMAKMRRFQPRIEQLKERYGEDKQKFQLALMELYKKEKINPVGGCFPVLIQMPVFLALYWMLSESVELRHAPWIGWIHDLTARDPYFILPAINIAVMWGTQKLSPKSPGMDPMQQKMMQYMPLAMGVLFSFMPAGLVLYWITNGSLGLLQQWWNTRRYGEQALPAKR